jgi:hypothetical protein
MTEKRQMRVGAGLSTNRLRRLPNSGAPALERFYFSACSTSGRK